MLTYDFRTMKATLWRLDTFILSFWRDPILIISFKVYMKDSASGFNEANVLQLAMDGPNVNWLVLNKLGDLLIANGHEKAVNIGSCAQHSIHGGFQTGTSNAGWCIDKILKAMSFILHDFPARQEVSFNVSLVFRQ